MRRRELIQGLGGAAASSAIRPLASRAQQMDRPPWIAVLTTSSESDVRNRIERAAFTEALAKLGWIDGRDIRIEHLWGDADDGRIRAVAAELAGKGPNVILASGTQVTEILERQTSVIPILFVNAADPVASGFVASFARPAGNVTGFTSVEFSLAGKWLSILRDLAPGIANVMVLYFPDNANWTSYLRTIEAAAESLPVTVRAAPMAAADEIVPRIESFAREPAAGMIVLPGGQTIANREMIVALAARHGRRFILTVISPPAEVSPLKVPTPPISTGAPLNMSTAPCAARGRATFRCRRRPSSSSSSISRPRRRSASRSRRRSSFSATR